MPVDATGAGPRHRQKKELKAQNSGCLFSAGLLWGDMDGKECLEPSGI